MGRAGKEIAPLPTGFSDFILNESSPPNCTCAMLAMIWRGCGETDRCLPSKNHLMLLPMVGPEESIRVPRKSGHGAIALQPISRYLVDASTYFGLVGHGCRSDGQNVSNTTVLYDSRKMDSFFTEFGRVSGPAP